MFHPDLGLPFRVIMLGAGNRVLTMRRAAPVTGSDGLWQCRIPPGIKRRRRNVIVSRA